MLDKELNRDIKHRVIAELTRSSHGSLEAYIPVCSEATRQDPEFISHLITWNAEHGQMRDSKVALPIIVWSCLPYADYEMNDNFADVWPQYAQNAIANILSLGPREFLKAARFGKAMLPQTKRMRTLKRFVETYLRMREARFVWWNRTALQHRQTLKELYALFHIKPAPYYNSILFDRVYPEGSVFWILRNIKNMSDLEAAGLIIEHKIPFLIAKGALGSRIKSRELQMALIKAMSPAELVTNANAFVRLGVKTDPITRASFEEALVKSFGAKNFKASRAAEFIDDEGMQKKLLNLQQRQMESMKAEGGVDGDWLVLGDKSGSMSASVETAKLIASTLAGMVKGQVHLIFFDTEPWHFDATNLTYDEIKKMTAGVRANGGTSVGCGLAYCAANKLNVDGIAIVSDGGENTAPIFHDAIRNYEKDFGKRPTVYLYRLDGEANVLSHNMGMNGIDFQEFDLTFHGIDYYSLPNLVGTMRTNRYSLIDEILATPLKAISDVLHATNTAQWLEDYIKEQERKS